MVTVAPSSTPIGLHSYPPTVTTPGDLWLPVGPGISYSSLPSGLSILDKTVNQIIGYIADTGITPQTALGSQFPLASSGDGVIEESTGNIWRYDGAAWEDVQSNPSRVIIFDNLIPFWDEKIKLVAKTRTNIKIESLPYGLNKSTSLTLITRTKVTSVLAAVAKVPVTGLTLTAFAPAVYVPVTVSVPLTTLTLTSFAPVIYTPVTVAVPLTTLTLTAFAPTLNLLSVPATALTLASFVPTVTGNATDPDFANVSLLLSMEGSNGSTTFTDLSNNAFSISVFGNAQVVTTDGDFLSGALDLDGTGDYLTTPSDAAFALGTGDFTIECYCKADVINDNDGLFTFGDINSGLALALYFSNWQLTTVGAGGTTMGAATASTRQHVAVCRSGTSLRLFIGGTQLGTTITDSTNFTDNQLKIGYYYDPAFPFNGRVSWMRVTKNVARYTANFTPPTAPFPTS